MKNAFIAILYVVLTIPVFAQSTAIDSIKQEGSKIGLKDFEKAIQINTEGLKRSAQLKDSVAYAYFNRSIGLAHYLKGNYTLAAQYYFISVAVLERQNDKRELANSYNELAKLYRKTKRLDLAEQTYDKAMRIYESLNDSANISMIYNESGVVFEYRENFDEALRRYKMSLQISERLMENTGIAYALNNIAGALSLQNKFDEADAYLKKALNLRKLMRDTFAIALNYSDLGMNNFYSGKQFIAISYLDSSNSIAQKLNYLELLSHNFLFISKAHEKSGNTVLALDFFKKHVTLKDSVFTIESDKQISELNTKYQTQKKDLELIMNRAEIDAQQKQNFIKTIIIISILVLIALLAGMAYLVYRKKQIEHQAKLDAQTAKEKEARTKAIVDAEEKERRRIAQDLHDGVGQVLSAAKLNLSSLQSRLKINTQEERDALFTTLSLIDDSVKEVRAVSHNMMPNTLIKLGLGSAVKEFITKIGNLPNLKIDLEIVGLDKRLDEQIETVLYRVIQEIVSNVMKHSKANAMNLQLVKHEGEITIMIEDNGVGFDVAKINEFSGIGLKNIISRVEYLNGSVHLDSTPGKGTNVIIEVPIKIK